jgi:hypothetical protein
VRGKSRARYSVPTPSLHEVQRLFWESVAVRPGRDSIAPAFVRLVRGADDSDRKTRICVYSDAYYLRLRDVLREDFPRVAAVLGAERFDEVVEGYLEEFPSEQPSVRHLGRALAEFLQSREDVPKCLADLAELEWARVEVFDAPDAECATIDELATVPPDAWPTLRFSTIPAIQTLRVQYPAHQLWSDSQSPEVPAAETRLRIWRKNDFLVLHAPMDARESAALHKMISGETFAAICETFAEMLEMDAAREATGLLARWIEDGIIARIVEAA